MSGKITNKEYDVTDSINQIIEKIPEDRLQDFFNSIPKLVSFQKEHNFDELYWIDDGKDDTYINNEKVRD